MSDVTSLHDILHKPEMHSFFQSLILIGVTSEVGRRTSEVVIVKIRTATKRKIS